MTNMRICERHERAYPSDGQCDWCEPAPNAGRHVAIDLGWGEDVKIGVVTRGASGNVPAFTDPNDPRIAELYGTAFAQGIREWARVCLPAGALAFRPLFNAKGQLRGAETLRIAWETPVSERRLCLTIERELRARGLSAHAIERVLVGRSEVLRDDGSIEVRHPDGAGTILLDVGFTLDEP